MERQKVKKIERLLAADTAKKGGQTLGRPSKKVKGIRPIAPFVNIEYAAVIFNSFEHTLFHLREVGDNNFAIFLLAFFGARESFFHAFSDSV